MEKISKKTQILIENELERIKNNIERISDLNDCTREHIGKLIADGCYSGEICELVIIEINNMQFEKEISGWWKIGDGKIEISIN